MTATILFGWWKLISSRVFSSDPDVSGYPVTSSHCHFAPSHFAPTKCTVAVMSYVADMSSDVMLYTDQKSVRPIIEVTGTSPEPFDSRAKAPPAKRSEKGYGNENITNVAVIKIVFINGTTITSVRQIQPFKHIYILIISWRTVFNKNRSGRQNFKNRRWRYNSSWRHDLGVGVYRSVPHLGDS